MTTVDPVLARQYLVAYINAPGGVPDPAVIEALLPKVREVFAVLDHTLAGRPYLAGEAFSLADMFLFPVIWFMRLKSESAALLQESPHLLGWYDRIAARPCAVETEPPVATGPAQPCKT